MDGILEEQAAWGGFTFLVGFLVVFRTSIAYSRFWDGVTSTHKMRAEWFDACASLCAFCKHSSESQQTIDEFMGTLVRMFSLMHAVALAEIEDVRHHQDTSKLKAWSLELIDDNFMDDASLLRIKETDAKLELIFQWIQQFIVENMKNGILTIPPPILSRAFQELNSGMVEFHEAMKVSKIPFPLPYAQTADLLLLMHGVLTPLIMSQWVDSVAWCGIFSFTQILVMWSLKAIAGELENPFGHDANDLDQDEMQLEMNSRLALLVDPGTLRTPTKVVAKVSHRHSVKSNRDVDAKRSSVFTLQAAWQRAYNRVNYVSALKKDFPAQDGSDSEPLSPSGSRKLERKKTLSAGIVWWDDERPGQGEDGCRGVSIQSGAQAMENKSPPQQIMESGRTDKASNQYAAVVEKPPDGTSASSSSGQGICTSAASLSQVEVSMNQPVWGSAETLRDATVQQRAPEAARQADTSGQQRQLLDANLQPSGRLVPQVGIGRIVSSVDENAMDTVLSDDFSPTAPSPLESRLNSPSPRPGASHGKGSSRVVRKRKSKANNVGFARDLGEVIHDAKPHHLEKSAGTGEAQAAILV